MRHLKNRLLEKCLVLYLFINLKLFHPEQRNFDQNDTRFLDTGEKNIFQILRFRNSRLCLFSISPMPGSNLQVLHSMLGSQPCPQTLSLPAGFKPSISGSVVKCSINYAAAASQIKNKNQLNVLHKRCFITFAKQRMWQICRVILIACPFVFLTNDSLEG